MASWFSNLAGTSRTSWLIGKARATIAAAGLSAARTFTLPDLSGTFALTNDTGNFLRLDGTNSMAGNLTFAGTGRRIIANFSNATQTDRLHFQTSVANAATSVPAMPNGTGTTSLWAAFNSSDPNNAGLIQLRMDATNAVLNSTSLGTGVIRPFSFQFGGTERMQLDTAGNLSLWNGRLYLGPTGGEGGELVFSGSGGSGGDGVMDSNGDSFRWFGHPSGKVLQWNRNSGVLYVPGPITVTGDGNPGNSFGLTALQVSGSYGGGIRFLDSTVNAGIYMTNAPDLRFGVSASTGALTEMLRLTPTRGYVFGKFDASDIISSRNSNAMVAWDQRDAPGDPNAWGWYASGSSTHLWKAGIGERLSVNNSGDLTAWGNATIVGGGMTVGNAGAGSVTITLKDDYGDGWIHKNDAQIGFLTVGSFSWAAWTDTGSNWTTSGNLQSNSDRRMKSDIRDIEDPVALVKAMRGRRYTKMGRDDIGFIAQEMDEVLPVVVSKPDDPEKMLSLNYDGVIPVLVEALKEALTRIEGLESRLGDH